MVSRSTVDQLHPQGLLLRVRLRVRLKKKDNSNKIITVIMVLIILEQLIILQLGHNSRQIPIINKIKCQTLLSSNSNNSTVLKFYRLALQYLNLGTQNLHQ